MRNHAAMNGTFSKDMGEPYEVRTASRNSWMSAFRSASFGKASSIVEEVCVSLAADRGVGVEDAREVGGRLGGGDHRQGEPPQLGEQQQGQQDVCDATRLAEVVGA